MTPPRMLVFSLRDEYLVGVAAASSSTDPKCTIVGVRKALLARWTSLTTGLSEIRVMTTNCNPISATADDPTIT